jgi:hypothetical protein
MVRSDGLFTIDCNFTPSWVVKNDINRGFDYCERNIPMFYVNKYKETEK